MPDTPLLEERVVDLALSPVEVYAKLRSRALEIPSFCFASTAPDSDAGRYSIVGYRVRRGAMNAPGSDAIKNLAAELEGQDAEDSFAQTLCQATIGFLNGSCALLRQGVPPYQGEGPAAIQIRESVIVLFDHQEDRVTIAGPKEGRSIDRCLHDLEEATEVMPPPEASPELLPADWRPFGDPAKLKARAIRAKKFLGNDLERLVLSQAFMCARSGADPFDVYRALRQATKAPHGYFIDFGKTPVGPWVRIAGCTDHPLHFRREHDAVGLEESLDASLPSPLTYGEPAVMAAKAIRKLETEPRHIYGGAVGYLAPGGSSGYVLADQLIEMEDESCFHTTGVVIDADTDPAEVYGQAHGRAKRVFSAIHAAQRKAAESQ